MCVNVNIPSCLFVLVSPHMPNGDGDLYYVCRQKKNRTENLAKVVCTAKEANDIFEEFHSSHFGGHCGWEKTHCAIMARYYWPGMEGNIKKKMGEQIGRAHV